MLLVKVAKLNERGFVQGQITNLTSPPFPCLTLSTLIKYHQQLGHTGDMSSTPISDSDADSPNKHRHTHPHAPKHTNLNSVLKIAKTNLLDMKPFSTSLSFKLSRGSMYFFSFSWKRECGKIKFDRGTQSKIWHHKKGNISVDSKRQQRLKQVHLGAKDKKLSGSKYIPLSALKREGPGDGRARRGEEGLLTTVLIEPLNCTVLSQSYFTLGNVRTTNFNRFHWVFYAMDQHQVVLNCKSEKWHFRFRFPKLFYKYKYEKLSMHL